MPVLTPDELLILYLRAMSCVRYIFVLSRVPWSVVYATGPLSLVVLILFDSL